jgi:ring-1,2-phenylacetyl-CoA epoxidase subunit PaaE
MTAAAHDFHRLTIAEVRRETADAISVRFEIPDSLREAFRFRPGQHLNLRAMLAGAEQRRSYSICSGPDEASPRIAIKRVPGGLFSTWANDALAAGHTLDVMPPAGRFVLPPGDGSDRHIVLLAAGAGITPIIAIAKQALASEPATRLTLIYGNRTPESTLFRQELEDLKDLHLQRFNLLHVLSRNEESDAPLFEGRITGEKVQRFAERLLPVNDIAHIFLCGPGSMIKETRNAFLALGMARERVHHEFFAAGGGAYRSAPPPPAIASTNKPAEVATGAEVIAILDGVRHRFTVPAGSHVVDAALQAGIRVPYSCKAGMCCTCRARVLEGGAQMTTNYSLEPWEIDKGFILTCQAVPSSERLVLDYDQL